MKQSKSKYLGSDCRSQSAVFDFTLAAAGQGTNLVNPVSEQKQPENQSAKDLISPKLESTTQARKANRKRLRRKWTIRKGFGK